MVKIIEPKIEIEEFNGIDIMKKLERACRTCYRSEDIIGEDTYKILLKGCINNGHESVLEHEKITVRFTTELGAYKDFTRHRLSSFSIESTRFCSYDKDKFNKEIKVINPKYIIDPSIYQVWFKSCEIMEHNYMLMKKLGAKNDECREILNHSVSAEVVMTCNIREWRHILRLRCTKKVHPSLKVIFIPLLLLFKKEMPELFEDIDYDKDFNTDFYANITFY